MAAAGIGGRWIETGAVGLAGGDSFLDRVIHLENDALGAVLAESLLVLATDDGKGVHDVGDGVSRGGEKAFEFRKLRGCFVARASIGAACPAPAATFVGVRVQVQVEEGCVELATEEETAFLVPTEGRTAVAAVVRERIEVPGYESQLQDAGEKPILNRRIRFAPWRGLVERRRRQGWNLLGDEEIEMRTAHLEACGEVTRET